MMRVFLFLAFLLGLGCKRKSSLPVIPKITFISMQPQFLIAGSSNQATRIELAVEDGDGDIGSGSQNLFFKDSRDASITAMTIPVIPSEYGPDKGVKGIIRVDYLAAWLLLRPDTVHFQYDTLRWEIFMKDQAGNISNTVFSDSLYLFK